MADVSTFYMPTITCRPLPAGPICQWMVLRNLSQRPKVIRVGLDVCRSSLFFSASVFPKFLTVRCRKTPATAASIICIWSAMPCEAMTQLRPSSNRSKMLCGKWSNCPSLVYDGYAEYVSAAMLAIVSQECAYFAQVLSSSQGVHLQDAHETPRPC